MVSLYSLAATVVTLRTASRRTGSDGKSWEPYDCDLHTGGSSYTVEGRHTTDRAVDMEQRTPTNESQPLIGATGAKRA
ncbi:hypothetical protein PI124_g23703 [Phytophthora idaei]|nr:hypothetical protein PI125_g25935 [Phytophthora idaei]KAG3123403.1 hypothetical protein PI126_g23725 [Phytophthora idaei]KAG3231202.1 hypothetical protein PI124_g23703 [Phytophthora idaei]